jgi:hypothetical protein
VLGESHYLWKGGPKVLRGNFTRQCIQEQVRGDYTRPFWTKIAQVFLGKKPSPKEKAAFWNSVAFYNYIQKPVGFGARNPPTPAMWPDAEAAFRKVLDRLRPRLVIVLGKRLWAKLPPEGKSGPPVKGAKLTDTWRYALSGGGSCLAYAIHHPAGRGFSPSAWHRSVLKALKLA